MHEEAIRKADVLIEALGFIRKFHGKFTVIKLGGSVMEDPEIAARSAGRHGVHADRRHAAGDRPRRWQSDHRGDGDRPGSRPISCRAGASPTSRRSTIVARVLAEEINADIERHINKFGGRASGLHHKTHQCLFGRKLWLENGPAGPHRPGPSGRGQAPSTCRRSRTCAWQASCRCFPRWLKTRRPKASS